MAYSFNHGLHISGAIPGGAVPPVPVGGAPGLMATASLAELLATVSSNGYRLSVGESIRNHDELRSGAFPEIAVSREHPQAFRIPNSWGIRDISIHEGMDPMASRKLVISSREELEELAALATGNVSALRNPELGQTLKALEDAGASLYVAGADYRPGSDDDAANLLHRKMLILDGVNQPVPDRTPPELAGAYGAYRADGQGTVFVAPPGAEQPTRVDSLPTARYFILGEGPAPSPLAARLRQLEQAGLGFSNERKSVGALGAYHLLEQGKPVDLTIDKLPVASLDASLEFPPEVFRALEYSHAKLDAKPGHLEALALPTGLTRAEVIALHDRVEQTVQGPGKSSRTGLGFEPTLGSTSWGYDPMVKTSPSRAAKVLRELCQTQLPGQSLDALVGQFSELVEQGLSVGWASSATAHLMAYPEARERLVELARLGAPSLAVTLQADAELPDAPARRAFAHLVPPKEVEPIGPALESFRHLQSHRWKEVSLDEDARQMGALARRLGHEKAREARAQLRPGQVELFLREHALSGDVSSALRCLAPGGHPDLPEPLEVREEAARLVTPEGGLPGADLYGSSVPRPVSRSGVDLNAFYRDGSMNFFDRSPEGIFKRKAPQSNYQFLLGLPHRNLPEDASLLATVLPMTDQSAAREFVADYRAGKLGRLTLAEMKERLEVEHALQGDPRQALDRVREGSPDHDLRHQRKTQLQERFGETVHEHWSALQTPLPQGASWEQGLKTLGKLCEGLPDQEGRAAYVALTDALRDGAWQGMSLEEGLETFLRACTLRDLEGALKRLETAPSLEEGGAGVSLTSGQINVGGVRLRTRR